MKKTILLVLTVIFTLCLAVSLSACKQDDAGDNSGNNGGGNNNVNITFVDKEVAYNGNEQSITITGSLPSGVTVTYTNNTGTNAGEYNATAVVSGEGFNTLNLSAKLTIKKATYDMSTATWSSADFTYDGTQKSVALSGLPSGVTIKNYSGNTATNAGDYVANATFNYDTLNYNAPTLNGYNWQIKKATYDMSTATWSSADFTYDGTQKSVTLSGLPNGVTIKNYSGNTATNAGDYVANATFNYDTLNYNAPTLNGYNWQIKKANFVGVTFDSETFEYDGNEKSIEVTGTPVNSSVVYVGKDDATLENFATDIGVYNIVATITNPNFNTLVLEATLTINGVEEERFMFANDGVLYFANAIHDDYLYAFDGTSVSLVSYDIPYGFTKINDTTYFRSKALFGGAIKEIAISSTMLNTNTVSSVKGEYITNDGTNLYYAVNALTSASSGIYKLTLSESSEPVATQLATGKAKFLQYYNGYIYFADGDNSNKLSKISVSGGAKTLVRDVKIKNLVQANGYLYYTVNGVLDDYIESYYVSNGSVKKLTSDAGTNLTVIGDTLYYLNVDLLSSFVFGKGIYYVDATPLVDYALPGNMLVGDATYSSLTAINSTTIAYYKITNTQELIVHNLISDATVNILQGFVAPETIPISLGSKMVEHDGLIYFLDLHKDKTLYSYNPITGKARKIIATKVADFSIVGDYLYYNAVSWLVDNNLYRINLKTGGEPEQISKYDANDIIFDGTNVFYVEKNTAGAATAIRVVSGDGTDPIVYSKAAKNLRYYDGYMYFINGDDLYKMPTTNYVKDEVTMVRKNDVDVFEIDNGTIYFREVLIINKQLSKINVDGTGYAVIKTGYDPVDITIKNGYIYYYSDTVSATSAGIYKISVLGGIEIKILEKTVSGVTYYPSELTILNGDIYFINYALGGVGGDSRLYKVNIATSVVTKVK